MRVLTGKLLNGKLSAGKVFSARLLEIGIALYVLAAPVAMARDEGAVPAPPQPIQLTQNIPPGVNQDQPAPEPTNPEQALPPLAQPGAQPLPAEIPKPFHGSVSLEAGNGKILTLTLPAANIYVADPKVAEVRPASSTSLFVFGVGPGQTTIAAVDMLGRLLADYQITVRPTLFGAHEAQSAIARLIPTSRIQVKPQGKGLMLVGAVANPSDAAQAMTIAKGFASGDGVAIGNQMTIASPTQVMLSVRIAEMQRNVVRNLGVNWQALGTLGQIGGIVGKLGIITAATNGAINCAAAGGSASSAACASGIGLTTAAIDALAQDNLAHILAEPNLTVMSGQPASFQVGGEFPIPIAGPNNTIAVTYKDYGILLNFVATVMNDGRINLHVKPEVSEITTANAASLSVAGTTQIVPALTVRRAETTVELGSGESFAIAGLLHDTTSDSSSGLPGLADTPVLGSLFRTSHLNRTQLELVIVVTPVVVRPVRNVAQLQLPAEGYKPAGDVDRLLLLRQMPNANGTATPRAPSEAGFIVR